MQVARRAAARLQLYRTKHPRRWRCAATVRRLLDSRMSVDGVCVAHHSHKKPMQQVIPRNNMPARTSGLTKLVQHTCALTLALRPVNWVESAARLYDGSSHVVRHRARGVEETGVCGRTRAGCYCVRSSRNVESQEQTAVEGDSPANHPDRLGCAVRGSTLVSHCTEPVRPSAVLIPAPPLLTPRLCTPCLAPIPHRSSSSLTPTAKQPLAPRVQPVKGAADRQRASCEVVGSPAARQLHSGTKRAQPVQLACVCVCVCASGFPTGRSPSSCFWQHVRGNHRPFSTGRDSPFRQNFNVPNANEYELSNGIPLTVVQSVPTDS